MLAERLAIIAWDAHNQRFDDLAKIVRAQGGSFETMPDGTSVARTPTFTAGFSAGGGDPIEAFVQTCFTLFGMFWPMLPLCAQAQGLINRWWGEGWPVRCHCGEHVILDVYDTHARVYVRGGLTPTEVELAWLEDLSRATTKDIRTGVDEWLSTRKGKLADTIARKQMARQQAWDEALAAINAED
jgi:hypothetical protein